MSARAIASICCSPPESEPASWEWRSFSRGNSANTRSRDQPVRAPSRWRCAATIRFSLTLRLRNIRRPCGTRQTPFRATASGASPAMFSPWSSMAPRRGLEEAHYGGHAGRLPRAVAPEQPQQATRPQRERDVMEDMAVPVERIDSANRKRLTRQDRPPACADRRPPRRACLRQ